MRVRRGSLVTVLIFSVITGLMVFVVGFTFARVRIENTDSYAADFTDASGLRAGLDVRASGVSVGLVKSIDLRGNLARVKFSIPSDLELTQATKARIRYANLTGDRYVELTRGDNREAATLRPGDVIPVERTQPALDLDTFFAGFDPLMQALNPEEVNKLTSNILAVTQGQSGAIELLLQQVASFSGRLSQRDELIGSVVTNLAGALGQVDDRRSEFSRLIVGLDDLLGGLARDRRAVAQSLDGISALAGNTSELLRKTRPSLKANLDQVGEIAKQVNAESVLLGEVLSLYPSTIQRLARGGAYGSFFNFYLCSVAVVVNLPGQTIRTPRITSETDRCKFPEDR